MSEYQYYEFQAIDRPLTAKEREYVSSLSSRTEATSHQAVFVYNYSDFRGRPKELLAKYFDAMLYLANWGTAQLMFRFPVAAVDVTLLSQYSYLDSIEITNRGDYVILDMTLREEEGFGWVDGDGYLPRMLDLRADILRGDMRAPYLVWLKIASYEAAYLEEDEDLTEPPVPANLKQRSLALETLMDFFQMDETLVSVAAETSKTVKEPVFDIEHGIAQLSVSEKDGFLSRVAKGDNIHFELVKRLKELVGQPSQQATSQTARRTITDLVKRSDVVHEERERKERLAAERKRNEYLDQYVKKIPQTWDKIFALIGRKQTKTYEEAISIMIDLRDVAKRDNWEDEFQEKIDSIYQQYPTLRGLHSRMKKKGF